MALIDEYCESYMAKIFYFCLKKTGVEDTAAELAAEINLEVVKALAGGVRPGNFGGWVWAVARNRWARFAKASYYGAEMDVIELSEAAESSAGDMSAEDNVILADELSRMRRELAFIRADYRQILVAHYFDDMSVSKIAELYNLPVGTVKTRLQASRRILKEGMEMAREFGKRSYNPEELFFTNNCTSMGDKGQPWSVLTHLLYKNILLECYDNPSTADQLSMELGIALPYMESELEYLTNETFLVKSGNRYETDFPILSADAQIKLHDLDIKASEKLSPLLMKLVDAAAEYYGDSLWGGRISYGDAKWTLLMLAHDYSQVNEVMPGWDGYTKRPDNGAWDIVGYQKTDITQPGFVGLHGNLSSEERLNSDIYFQQYKYMRFGLDQYTPVFLSERQLIVLYDILHGSSRPEDKMTADELANFGYLKKNSSGYSPAMAFFSDRYRLRIDVPDDACGEKAENVRSLRKEIMTITSGLNADGKAVINGDLPERFRGDPKYSYLTGEYFLERGYTLDAALECGWLKHDDNTMKNVGAFAAVK
ncbi:MAG: RNA polymerase sigma factor [Clostridiales bacterium]|nr:RNA polymerase sigma factor [Clostridiales bacterium]